MKPEPNVLGRALDSLGSRLKKERREVSKTGFASISMPHSEEEGTKSEFIRLGAVIYSVETGSLSTASGDQIFLRAQSAEVLSFLIRNLGKLVSRDDLISHVWPNIAVTDDSLTQCIRDIRKAIGDKNRTILETIPKRGFTVHGVIVGLEEYLGRGQINKIAATIHQPAISAEAHQRTLVAELGELNKNELAAQLDPRDMMPTLAILPFRGDREGLVDYFGVFIADEIAKLLGMAEDVNVVSRLSTGTMGGVAVPLEDVRTKLNADFVLSGYLVRQGEKVALSLEFAETDSGYVLWTERVLLPFNPAAPETEGLDLVVSNIRRSIMLNEVRRIHSRPFDSLKLFSILHGAVGLMHRFSPKDFALAKGYLDHLHAQMPKHPAPLAWMARWHVLKAVQGWADDPKAESETALRHTAGALDIDPGNTLALVCEGHVLVHLAQDLDAAEQRYDQALETNPNDTNGRALRGMLRAFTDRGDLGKRDTERALHLTPLDPHRFFYLALAAGACIANEEFERAVTLTKESLRLNRAHGSSLRMLPVALLGAGETEAARNATHDLLLHQPDLRVSDWLKTSPSADFKIGRMFSEKLKELGVPD